jgi:hypothetical protein
MTNAFESAPPAIENIDPRYQKIINGPPSSDYTLRQTQLAVEKFHIEKPFEHLDREKLEEILMTWGDAEDPNSDSRKFAAIARHVNFNNHPKFKGNVANITVEDMME